ncbi:MAG: tetratricopeptide repeat protein [Xanthomonadales bacterium]|nr:tetratricopeptide repeat protein [Xanthomonadales bacterium]
MNLFNELKRRNVFRVGIAYAVVAWLVMQFADVVLNNITAPGWVFQAIMLLLAIGFPIVLVFAWAFEMTPEGLKKEKDIDRSQSIAPRTGRKLDRTIIVFMALALAYFIYDKFSNEVPQDSAIESVQTVPANETDSENRSPGTPVERSQDDKSVAVLPFAFRSTDPEDQFFAEGMHDDLLTQLAKIGSLKVISRTSVMEYKDTTKKIPQIAEELGVSTIVEGGVQRSGSRIRFNAQLIDAQTDEHLWAETYNRELTAENLFDIQAEIARAIAQALHATLSLEEEANISRVLTTNLEAWESYQQAIRLSQTQGIASMKMGSTEVDHAIELDPGFAAAWSLKATILLQQYWFYDTDPATRDAARDAIENGRKIDPTLPELDIAEGYYYYWGYRDYATALPFMQRASAALPNNARAHQARAFVLRRMGEWESALTALRRAAELDPRNVRNVVDIGETLIRLRRYEEASQILTTAQARDPDNPSTLWRLGELHLQASGDINSYSKLNHFAATLVPNAQLRSWRSSLYLDDYEAALLDVANWQEGFLDTRDYRVTRPMLTGLTYLYAGNIESATPLLRDAKLEFETLLEGDPDSYTINHSLCFITGGLGELANARKYCQQTLQTAPADAFFEGYLEFEAAAGLALAGDAQSAAERLRAMLNNDVGPTTYQVIYHPAFDGIRDDPAYISLLKEYGPEK